MVKKVKIDILQFFGALYGGDFVGKSPVQNRSILTKLGLVAAFFMLSFYRVFISPVLYAIGVRCRHEPSCSQYSGQAIWRHGIWRGGWLTLSRLLRCHPWGSHGLDEVPIELPRVGWKVWRYGDWSWRERSLQAQSSNSKEQE